MLLAQVLGTQVGDVLDERLHVLHRERPIPDEVVDVDVVLERIPGTHGAHGAPREDT